MNDAKDDRYGKCDIEFCKGGGCTAKLGAGALSRVLGMIPKRNADESLIVGYDSSDDAAVYRISPDTAMIHTLDFFPPMVEDPYTFGQIAATNALSDVYAMGGEPKLCLNIMAIPETMPREAVHALLRGGYDKVYEAGALITGGHSILDDEPKYGLAVTGFVHPDRVLTNAGAKPGDVLFLTKPIGIGVLTTAGKAGLLSADDQALCIKLMTTLNKAARDVMVKYRVHACTDVTGFGLLGHGSELAQGSDVQLVHQEGRLVRIDVGELARAEQPRSPQRPAADGGSCAGFCPRRYSPGGDVPQPRLCRAHGGCGRNVPRASGYFL